MSLAKRIAELEARLRPAPSLPVAIDGEADVFQDRPGLRTIMRVHDGATWPQLPDESSETFRERIRATACLGIRQAPALSEVRCIVLRPRLSREQWLQRHGAGHEPASATHQLEK